jgi:hypothetical protein
MSDIRGSKYLLIRDIESCPYVPKDYQYKEWNKKDIERCQILVEVRKNLHEKLNSYLCHEDRNVRNMALFLDWFWGGK